MTDTEAALLALAVLALCVVVIGGAVDRLERRLRSRRIHGRRNA